MIGQLSIKASSTASIPLCSTGEPTVIMQTLHLLSLLSCLATVFAVPTATQITIRWCVIAEELQKCNDLKQRAPLFNCVQKNNHHDCIVAIKNAEADIVTLSAENVYKAGLLNYNLKPIIAESYNNENNPGRCSYSVAVAKKTTGFFLRDLREKKSCHAGMTPEGWILPIGTLLTMGVINWESSDNKPLETAVSEFFSGSSGDADAFKCLQDNVGDVAFMNPADIPEHEKGNYELLCEDNTRKSVDEYKSCNLGQQPARAVVTRNDMERDLVASIYSTLTTVRGINLYSSESYGSKNLLFSDSAVGLLQVPFGTDWFLYLGPQYSHKIQALNGVKPRPESTTNIRWCAVGHDEKTKCDLWSGYSLTDNGEAAIDCQSASSVEECFKKIKRNEADAVAVDGGQVYTAGMCGLVPAMVEQYEEAKCSSSNSEASSYYAVAVIKKGLGVTWENLKGKRSCHTGFGRTAGWNIPMGLIHEKEKNCNFANYFSAGCAPGADLSAELSSTFCSSCIGSEVKVGSETTKCKASAEERYYGYSGAFRCLAEGAGDVAFIKHTIVGENTDGRGPSWASALSSTEFELICPGNPGSVSINSYESCHLAKVPAHAVVTRSDIRNAVIRILNEQQARFGQSSDADSFKMFQSVKEGVPYQGKNLLFKDSTKCLQEIPSESYETFLGNEYMTAMKSLRVCTDTTPDLEKSCTFQSCQ